MNTNTISAECDAEMCAACRFEDCACECHAEEREAKDDAAAEDCNFGLVWPESFIY